MDKVFIQIASYRDPELIPTIQNLLERAKNPERFVFGICWQYDETEEALIKEYEQKENFRISKFHYSESKGLGWARNITQSLWEGEKYTMQIDSHHRFVEGWDEIIFEDYEWALKESVKPILTTYMPQLNLSQKESQWIRDPCVMEGYDFTFDYLLLCRPYYITNHKNRKYPLLCRFLSAHFFFADARFIKDVPYDPEIYFGGYTEESTMGARAWTDGYDLYTPHRLIGWHEYTREYRVKHWDDHQENEPEKDPWKDKADGIGRCRTRQLFQQYDHGIDLGNYGLGKERTLEDYQRFVGVNFKRLFIHKMTKIADSKPPSFAPREKLNDVEGYIDTVAEGEIIWPPKSPLNFSTQEENHYDVAKEFKVLLKWDKERLLEMNIKDWKKWHFRILNDDGIEVAETFFDEGLTPFPLFTSGQMNGFSANFFTYKKYDIGNLKVTLLGESEKQGWINIPASYEPLKTERKAAISTGGKRSEQS